MRSRIAFIIFKYKVLVYKILKINILTSIFIFGTYLFIFWFAKIKLLNFGEMANLQASHGYYNFLNYLETYYFTYSLIGLVTTILISFLTTVFIAYPLIGPLNRIENELEDISDQKKIHNLTVRKNDILRPLLDKINKVFNMYEK